ncbi:uncharacterized protein EHS24_000045 [Apiotrichum porosum]|uniref:Uncharacterized protein n=1 Tax=Apiotrichum porosum TaxID=105984 RepID=A0A427Y8T9_9TREE|nr:uncharacterized protein EHS24_000045 [Apiotrichum porosum]RSH87536.1 hypothetical protein EHS24_000045 [Apiotrichum porosum]
MSPWAYCRGNEVGRNIGEPCADCDHVCWYCGAQLPSRTKMTNKSTPQPHQAPANTFLSLARPSEAEDGVVWGAGDMGPLVA